MMLGQRKKSLMDFFLIFIKHQNSITNLVLQEAKQNLKQRTW